MDRGRGGFQRNFSGFKKGRFFFISILLKDSFPELQKVYRQVSPKTLPPLVSLRFPSVSQLDEIVARGNPETFKVDRELVEKKYENSLEFLKALKKIGARNPLKGLASGSSLVETRKLIGLYDSSCSLEEGGVKATYSLWFGEGQK